MAEQTSNLYLEARSNNILQLIVVPHPRTSQRMMVVAPNIRTTQQGTRLVLGLLAIFFDAVPISDDFSFALALLAYLIWFDWSLSNKRGKFRKKVHAVVLVHSIQ